MDSLRNAAIRLKQFFAAMSTAQRLSLVLIAAAVVISIGILMAISARLEYVSLFEEELTPRQIAEYADFVGGEARIEGNRIMVPRPRKRAIMARLLEENRVPGTLKYGFEDIPRRTGLGGLPAQDALQSQLNLAKSREIAAVLTWIDKVQSARVFAIVPSRTDAGQQKTRAKASVMLKLRPSEVLDAASVEGITSFVASSFKDISPQDVVIVDASTGRRYSIADREEAAVMADTRLALKKKVESYYSEKAKMALDFLSDQVIAITTAEIDFRRITEKSTDYDPEDKVEIKVDEERIEEGEIGQPKGITQVGGKTGARPTATEGPSRKIRREKKERRYSFTEQSIENIPGEIKDLSISVIVPLERVTSAIEIEKTTTASLAATKTPVKVTQADIDAKLAEYKTIVLNALKIPESAGANREDKVTVSAQPFEMPVQRPAAISVTDRLIFLFSRYGGTALVALLAIIALLMIRSIVKKSFLVQKSEEPGEAPPGLAPTKSEIEALPAKEVERRVGQMIEEHPMETASLLKRWIH